MLSKNIDRVADIRKDNRTFGFLERMVSGDTLQADSIVVDDSLSSFFLPWKIFFASVSVAGGADVDRSHRQGAFFQA